MDKETLYKVLKQAIQTAEREEDLGKKHKGLILVKSDNKKAEEYINKAKLNLELCELYLQKGFDYKLPEEWFYTLYYCALAILSRFGVESRSQKYTALFLKYVKLNELIDYEDEFIDRITVHSEKEEQTDVDKREESRYSSSVKIEKISLIYEDMTLLCKRAIFQSEEVVFSDKTFAVPRELII